MYSPLLRILLLLLGLFPSPSSTAPTGSYLYFGRHDQCAGIYFGDGAGLPRGDFTISYWVKYEAGYHR